MVVISCIFLFQNNYMETSTERNDNGEKHEERKIILFNLYSLESVDEKGSPSPMETCDLERIKRIHE